MDDKTKKKGLISRLLKSKDKKPRPCCGGFVIEDAKEGEDGRGKENNTPQTKKPSCCG